MRDPRVELYTESEIAAGWAAELGPDVVQQGDAIMSRVPGDPKPAAQTGRFTEPKPPPAELGFDRAKWNTMARAERRAVLRYAKAGKR